jgi:hypothetical protein
MEPRQRSLNEQQAHLRAIDKIVARWQAGEITLAQKRELIFQENTWFRGHSVRGRTGSLITAERGHKVTADDDDEREDWWQR